MPSTGFLVEHVREGERHLDAVAIVTVRNRVDDRHRARKRELEFLARASAGELCLRGVHATLQRERPRDGRHHRLVAVIADTHFDAPAKINAVDGFKKAVNKVLP
jgi:hypothetical protein